MLSEVAYTNYLTFSYEGESAIDKCCSCKDRKRHGLTRAEKCFATSHNTLTVAILKIRNYELVIRNLSND